MRYPASEKLEIIRLAERSHLPAARTLEMFGIPQTTFYRWYDRYRSLGEAGLEDRRPHPGWVWNQILVHVRQDVDGLAPEEPELSPRELAVRFTDTKKHLVSKASLSTILDDFSRYVFAWRHCTTMRAEDVTETLQLALEASAGDQPTTE